MRLYHRQLIGLRPGGSGYVNSYGADFVKKLEYTCSIFDVGKNSVVWRLPVMQEENSQSLGLFETSVRRSSERCCGTGAARRKGKDTRQQRINSGR